MYFRQEKNYFKLDIDGYEFPNADEYYDSNWLIVSVRCSYNDDQWEARDSCLLTFELKNIKAWLNAIILGAHEEYLTFMESELAFKYKADSEILSIALNYNLHIRESKHETPYVMKFKLRKHEISYIVNAIDKLINKYPERLSE